MSPFLLIWVLCPAHVAASLDFSPGPFQSTEAATKMHVQGMPRFMAGYISPLGTNSETLGMKFFALLVYNIA